MDKYGLIGDPITHSKSPRMQTAAIKSAKLNATYQLLNDHGEKLSAIMERLRKSNVAGFNVTTPFKQTIIPFLDELDVTVAKIQAVNTVKNVDGKLIGYSTDGSGFWQSMPEIEKPINVVIIGAGGAAKAIIGAAPLTVNIQVFNRESPAFDEHKAQLAALFGLELQPLSQLLTQLESVDLLINATSVGLHDNVSVLSEADFELLKANALVIDLVYRHAQTSFLEYARKTEHQTMSGLPMLVMQGAHSFKIWHNKIADIKSMELYL